MYKTLAKEFLWMNLIRGLFYLINSDYLYLRVANLKFNRRQLKKSSKSIFINFKQRV